MHGTIYYDDHCILCNRVIRFLLSRRNGSFQYVALDDSDPMQEDFGTIDSLVYVQDDQAYYESRAVLRILRDMGGIYKLVSKIGSILPKGITDRIYRSVSSRRYVLWGKIDGCPLPKDEIGCDPQG